MPGATGHLVGALRTRRPISKFEVALNSGGTYEDDVNRARVHDVSDAPVSAQPGGSCAERVRRLYQHGASACAGQVASSDQPVVAASDDDHIGIYGHVSSPCPDAGSAARLGQCGAGIDGHLQSGDIP